MTRRWDLDGTWMGLFSPIVDGFLDVDGAVGFLWPEFLLVYDVVDMVDVYVDMIVMVSN